MKLVFATNNLNKLSEIKSVVKSGIEILSLDEINCNNDLPETFPTLYQNALQKAKYVYENYGLNCFADDTGLEIDALEGAPGVYSARYAGNHCNSEENIKKVLNNMREVKDRVAKFRTVIALIIDGREIFFEGECVGQITNKKSGVKGFGYDSIFMPYGHNKTFAEMSQHEKGTISHRGKAVNKLTRFLSAS